MKSYKVKETMETLEMLLDVNKKIAELLELINSNCEKNLKKLQCYINEESGDSSIEEEANPEVMQSKESESVALEETRQDSVAETVKDTNKEPDPVEVSVKEKVKKYPLADVIASDIEPINKFVDALVSFVKNLYAEDDRMYTITKSIKEGYDQFLQYDCGQELGNAENLDEHRESIVKILVESLGEYGWVNTVLRIYAYSNTEKFKYEDAKDMLGYLYRAVVDMYRKFGIEVKLPDILNEEYDKTKYDFSSASSPKIEYYCNVKAAEYRKKIYDIIKVGYSYTAGEEEIVHKPVVFYNL